jgi:hypothetical protein
LKDVSGILRSSLRDVWDDLWMAVVCNMLWLAALVLVIPGPPATLALFYYGNRLARGEQTDLGDFLRAIRHYWGTAWRWGLVNLALVLVLASDILLLQPAHPSIWLRFGQGFYLALLMAWCYVQLFALPFLFEQERPTLRLAWRNAAVMLGRNIGFSITLGLSLGLVLFAGALFFLVSAAVGGVYVAASANRAVLDRLAVQLNADHRGLP